MPRLDAKDLQLPPRYLEMLRDLLQRYLPQTEVWAYGSRVNGDCHAASDLDLVARNSANLTEPLSNIFDLKDALMESHLPIRVDVVDWARIPEPFRLQIERGYVVICES